MADPLLYLLPEKPRAPVPGLGQALPTQPAAFTYEIPPIESRQARITRNERSKWQGWGDLNAPRLANVLLRAEQGDVADWYDLCEFAVRDPGLGSLYATRIDRVAQAELVIKPNPYGNPREAELAAEFCNEQLGRIRNWSSVKRKLLHAVASGFSAGELMLEYDDAKHTPNTTPTNYIDTIEWVHGHRFRYDEQWNLRLYDRGLKRSKASIYGEALLPHKWAIHSYTQVAGYPGLGGLMASCIWEWMFMRWVEKFWIGGTERNGGPFIWASVSENLAPNRKQELLDELEQFTTDRFAVFEMPSKPEINAAAAAARSHEAYVDYQTHHEGRQAKLWLGASDIADPGKHGSQSAVDSRGAMTTDPRMVTDASLFGESMQETLLPAMIAHNPHKFGVPVSQVPIPEMVLKTADDQVRKDATGRAYEVQAETEANEAAGAMPHKPGEPMEPGKQQPQQDGGGDAMVLEIMKAFAASELPRSAAGIMLKRHGFSEADIASMLPLDAVPKAPAPARPGRPTTTTRGTSGRSPSLIAAARRVASGASVSSSSKPRQQQLKL